MADTAGNFLRGVPLAVGLSVVLALFGRVPDVNGASGVMLAVVSGAVAVRAGIRALVHRAAWLTRAQSGVIQLAPAPLATFAGLILLGEPITGRVLLASVMILGGVLLAVVRRQGRPDAGSDALPGASGAGHPADRSVRSA